MHGPLVKGGRYELRSHSGDVTLAPTSTTGFEVEASTFSGTFQIRLPGDAAIGRSVDAQRRHAASSAQRLRRPRGAPPTPPPPPPARRRTAGSRRAAATRPLRPAPPRPAFPAARVQGTFGDGGSMLFLASFSGDITIVKK